MIHTMQLTYLADDKLYQAYLDTVPRQKNDPTKPVIREWRQRNKKGKERSHKRYYATTEVWKQNGITGITDNSAYQSSIIDPSTGSETKGGYIIELRINLLKLIKRNEHVDVYHPGDREQVIQAFNDAMDLLKIGMPHWDFWNVKRVDYCYNIITPYVKYYTGHRTGENKKLTALLHKGKYPKYTNENKRNVIRNKGSLYLRWKSFNVNFYDKHDEIESGLVDAFGLDYDKMPEDLQDAYIKSENVLRVEVQCGKQKLNSIRRQFYHDSYNANAASLFLNPEIAERVVEHGIKSVCCTGYYYREKRAEQIINQSRCNKSTKQELILILKEIRKAGRNITSVGKLLADDGIMSEEKYHQRLKTLTKLGVNPVTIPQTTKKIGDLTRNDGLPSLMDLFMAAASQERKEDPERFRTWMEESLDKKHNPFYSEN